MQIINESNYQDKTAIIIKINELLSMSEKGLYVILETTDTSNGGITTWQSHGISMHKSGGTHGMSPESVCNVQEKSDYISLIWVNKDKCKSSVIDFAFVYAHECQHLLQNKQWPGYHGWDKQHKQEMSGRGKSKCSAHDLPCEKDADITAVRVCAQIFGDEVALDYFENIGDGRKEFYINILKNKNYSNIDLAKEYKRILGGGFVNGINQ